MLSGCSIHLRVYVRVCVHVCASVWSFQSRFRFSSACKVFTGHSLLCHHLGEDVIVREGTFICKMVCPMWHCRPAVNISQVDSELNEFMESAPAGVIYPSMRWLLDVFGAALCQLFVAVFTRLPHHHVLWTWAGNTSGLLSAVSSIVRVHDWLPQQDIHRHSRLKLFIIHGGLLSQHEPDFHLVPQVMLNPCKCSPGPA